MRRNKPEPRRPRSVTRRLMAPNRYLPPTHPGPRRSRSFSRLWRAGSLRMPPASRAPHLPAWHERSRRLRLHAANPQPLATRLSLWSGEDTAQRGHPGIATSRPSRNHWRGLPDRWDRRRGPRPYPSIPKCPKIHIRRSTAAQIVPSPLNEAGFVANLGSPLSSLDWV